MQKAKADFKTDPCAERRGRRGLGSLVRPPASCLEWRGAYKVLAAAPAPAKRSPSYSQMATHAVRPPFTGDIRGGNDNIPLGGRGPLCSPWGPAQAGPRAAQESGSP